MRREDIEKPRRPIGTRMSAPPMRKGEGIEGCPMCVRAGKVHPNRVVYGKDRCIDHLAEQAEGMQLEKVIASQPVKKKRRLPGALS